MLFLSVLGLLSKLRPAKAIADGSSEPLFTGLTLSDGCDRIVCSSATFKFMQQVLSDGFGKYEVRIWECSPILLATEARCTPAD